MTILFLLRSSFLTALAAVTLLIVSSTPALALSRPQSRLPERYSYSTQSYSTMDPSNSNALNWAGYVATDGTYTSVSGSWNVPTVQSSAENVADATWIGIGGVTSSDLIQAGTEAIPDSRGDLVYQAWYETLPQDSKAVPLAISPGDSVSVSITETSGGLWNISFFDATTGKSYSTSMPYNSSLSSADWIEEMPVELGGAVGLDNFGTVTFSSGYAIKNGQAVTIATSGAKPLTMDNSMGETVAQTSALALSSSSFSVSRTSAASTPLALARSGINVIAAASEPYAYSVPSTTYVTRTGRFGRGGRGGMYRIVIEF